MGLVLASVPRLWKGHSTGLIPASHNPPVAIGPNPLRTSPPRSGRTIARSVALPYFERIRYWPFRTQRGFGLLTESADELEVGDIWLPKQYSNQRPFG